MFVEKKGVLTTHQYSRSTDHIRKRVPARHGEETEWLAVKPEAVAGSRVENRQQFTLYSFSIITSLLRALMGLIKRQR